MIPILNLTRQYELLKDRIDEALIQVAASGAYILGPNVKAFEEEMAQWLGVRHVIGCANGSDALFLALKALKIGAPFGKATDEVITTPFSFVATSESIVRAGARPVFIDIEPDSFNLDVTRLEAAITPNTRAIMPVHLYGQPANMDEIRRIAKAHNLYVVEDCAQAVGAEYKGAKVGGLGDIGCFSFFPSKNLGALGDGGMMCTNDDELADRLRMLRVHGSRRRYYHDEPGINSRLDELQAAVLRVKLPHLAQWNQARRHIADGYDRLLAPLAEFIETPARTPDTVHVFHQYTVKLRGELPGGTANFRNELQARLQEAGVQTMIYYPLPLYKQETHAGLNCSPADYPVCERVSDQVLSLPMFPELRPDEQEAVAQALAKVFEALPVTV